jgi:hypothetical protein
MLWGFRLSFGREGICLIFKKGDTLMQSVVTETKQYVIIAALLFSLVSPVLSYGQEDSYPAPGLDFVMPIPRELISEEKAEVERILVGRFGVGLPREVQYTAAGAFRFVGTKSLFFVNRADLGSLAFERARYGVSQEALDPTTITEELLLPRIKAALVNAGILARGMTFAGFQDEFTGAAPPSELPREFDPRHNSLHVARTATFDRHVEGLPIFGSELLVGLMPNGRIGRLRWHWPKIDPDMVAEAYQLQKSVRSGDWSTPEELRDPTFKILDSTVGIGHSGFADPGFGALPVVRFLVRKTTDATEHPLVSTAYRYFDVNGREVRFSNFPQLPGSTIQEKKGERE